MTGFGVGAGACSAVRGSPHSCGTWLTSLCILRGARVPGGSSEPVGQRARPRVPAQQRAIAVTPVTGDEVIVRAEVTDL